MVVCNTFVFHAVLVIVYGAGIVFTSEYLALDENLTRREITTVIQHPVNLGCYVTKVNSSQIPTSLTFVWSKDNKSVQQSPAVSIHGNVLVVTPKTEKDFGIYKCDVTNGVSKTLCEITLVQGWTNSGPVAGCINVSVLMPVLAVAVLSCLLLVHLVVRRKEPKILMAHQRRRKSTSSLNHPHAEQRQRSRDLLYNSFRGSGTLNNNEKKQEVVSIEMHLGKNGDSTASPPEEDGITGESKRERKRSEFSNRSFMQHSIEMDDSEAASQSSDESKNTGADKSSFYQKSFKSGGPFDKGGDGFVPRASVDAILSESKTRTPHAFYNKTYANQSMDSSDGEVFASVLEETVGIDAPKGGKAKGFINKTYHTDSIARVTQDSTSGEHTIGASQEAEDITEHAPDMDTYF